MLQPALSLILGNLQYESHVGGCVATLGLLPQINCVSVTLPSGVEISADVGDDAALSLLSDGEMMLVFTGRIGRIQHRFYTVEVLLVDGGQALAHTRAAATYEGQDSGKVIRSLAREAGVAAGSVEAALPLASYVAHQNATVADHVARLAALSGCIAHVSADGRLHVVTRPAGQPDVALLYGREFVRYAASAVAPPADQLILAGNGPAGNPAEPGALRHSATLLPASAPAPSVTARRVPSPLLKTPSAAVSAGQAINMARAAASRELTAHCFLLPHIRPGRVVQVQGLPAGIPEGPWLVTRIDHRLQGVDAGQSIVHAELADLATFGLDTLLGAALNFAGGLL